MRGTTMDNDKVDLWAQFSDDGEPEPEPKPKKTTPTDGTEWTGKYDRRSKPRDGDAQADQQSDDGENKKAA